MKVLKLSATLMLLGALTLGMAEDVVIDTVTVDDQITAIESATPEERVTLVNDFKQTLSTLSREERAVAIATFRSAMQANGDQLQTRTREGVRVNQMIQTDSMQRTEQMNQHQGTMNANGGVTSGMNKGKR